MFAVRGVVLVIVGWVLLGDAAPLRAEGSDDPAVVAGTASSTDGVPIAYTSSGSGEPALVLIHGGFADQEFWQPQVDALSDRYRVVTLDLAGHGRSGKERTVWSIEAFGEDVRAVVDELGLESMVLVGNSLGGPVALSAAEKMPQATRGIVAVDTLQDVDQDWTREELEAYVARLRDDFPGTCKEMVDSLLVEGTDPELYTWIASAMCSFDPDLAHRVVAGFFDYDRKVEFAGARVPVRGILGEIVPLDLEGNRALLPDFDAVVMKGCGHYPMLERPGEFNQHLVVYVEEMAGR